MHLYKIQFLILYIPFKSSYYSGLLLVAQYNSINLLMCVLVQLIGYFNLNEGLWIRFLHGGTTETTCFLSLIMNISNTLTFVAIYFYRMGHNYIYCPSSWSKLMRNNAVAANLLIDKEWDLEYIYLSLYSFLIEYYCRMLLHAIVFMLLLTKLMKLSYI